MSSRYLPLLLLAFVACILFTSLPTASAQQGCYPCIVNITACNSFFGGNVPNVSIGAASPAIAAAECATLNTDLTLFIATALNSSCQQTVANLSCSIIATVQQTEQNCNTSSIGIGTQFGNTSFFQSQCASAVSCLGYTVQDELTEFGACSSFQSFLASAITQPTPSAVTCTACNIPACYNLSTVPGVTNVTFWTGSLPGLPGNACGAQQAVAQNLLASASSPLALPAVQQAVCNPLAALSLADTQQACQAGAVDPIFDQIIFTVSTGVNQTWTQYCQQTIPQLFNSTVAPRLIQSGYCIAPSIGLTNYALTYLNVNATSTTNSTGGGGSSGTYPQGSYLVSLLYTFNTSVSAAVGAPLVKRDIAYNIAQEAGYSNSALVEPYVVITTWNGASLAPTSRRLLQTQPTNTSVSFIVLGNITSLSSTFTSPSAVVQRLQTAASAGALVTPYSNATIPAQAVTAVVAGSSTSSSTGGSGSTGTSAASSSHVVMAPLAIVVLLLSTFTLFL